MAENEPDKKTFRHDEPFMTIPLSRLNDDWLAAARLKKKADAGDQEAKRTLAEWEATIAIDPATLEPGQ